MEPPFIEREIRERIDGIVRESSGTVESPHGGVPERDMSPYMWLNCREYQKSSDVVLHLV